LLTVFRAGSNPILFYAGWFVEPFLTQTPIIHVIRTCEIPFIQNRASWPLIITSIIIVAAGAWLTALPLAHTLGFVPLPTLYGLPLAIMLPGYVILTQLAKTWFYRRFGD
jgi:Mg2+-importing ATPase